MSDEDLAVILFACKSSHDRMTELMRRPAAFMPHVPKPMPENPRLQAVGSFVLDALQTLQDCSGTTAGDMGGSSGYCRRRRS